MRDDPRGRGRKRRPAKTEKTAPRLENPEVLTQHDDGVAWLLVKGTGVWGYSYATGEFKKDRNGADTEFPVCEMRNFPAGIHWVDQETVDFASKPEAPATLMITQTMPDVVRRRIEGPLSPAHFDGISDDAIVLRPEAEATVSEGPVDEEAVPLDFPCGYCERRLPSSASRDLHIEFEHASQIQADRDALPEPEPVESPLTDA